MEGDWFLLQVVLVVLSCDGAPTGRGGEGSACGRWLGAGSGGPGCGGSGWMLGGAGKMELWPCSFIETWFRRLAADGCCGSLQCVAAPSSRRRVVRCLRLQLGVLGVWLWI